MRARSILLLIMLTLASVAAALMPTSARAECAMMRPFLTPAPGAALPTQPTLHAFVPDWLEGDLEVVARGAGGAAVPVSVTWVEEGELYRVARLTLEAPEAGAVTVEVVDAEGKVVAQGQYTLEAGWRAPTAAAVEVTEVREALSAWTCSHNATQELTLSAQAPVYRVEWADSAEDYAAGRRETRLLPGSMLSFFRPEHPYETGVVSLGHVDCAGFTFRWEMRAPAYVGVAALYPDRSEIPAESTPVEVVVPSFPW